MLVGYKAESLERRGVDADGEDRLSGCERCRREINCEMGRVFPGYEGGLRPEFRFLKDKAVIIQAWKKAQY